MTVIIWAIAYGAVIGSLGVAFGWAWWLSAILAACGALALALFMSRTD